MQYMVYNSIICHILQGITINMFYTPSKLEVKIGKYITNCFREGLFNMQENLKWFKYYYGIKWKDGENIDELFKRIYWRIRKDWN